MRMPTDGSADFPRKLSGLYRSASSLRSVQIFSAVGFVRRLPTGSRRHSRLETRATTAREPTTPERV